MVLTFKSTTPERFFLVGVDQAGRRRVASAEKHSGDFYWQLKLTHPNGQSWQGTHAGPNILDALSELVRSRDTEYRQDKQRGDRPPAEAFDHNRSVNDGVAPIVPIPPRR